MSARDSILDRIRANKPKANTRFPSSRGLDSRATRISSRSLSGISPAWAVEACGKVLSNLCCVTSRQRSLPQPCQSMKAISTLRA